MIFSVVYLVIRCLLRILLPDKKLDDTAEIELLVLRHELKILRRQIARPKLGRRDRILLAAASKIIPRARWSLFIVTPQTLLRWHRDLVRRKWTFRRRSQGRPGIEPDVRDLIVRFAKENPRWGYRRIQGELKKLGIRVSANTVRNVSVFLKTLHIMFFIHLSTRKILLAAATPNPDSFWIAQQARNLFMELPNELRLNFLLRDRDSKYSGDFDEVFRTEGAKLLRLPFRAPKANAYAERWVRTLRQECLDHLLIISRSHLDKVLTEFVRHYNHGRPHRGLGLETPQARQAVAPTQRAPRIRRNDILRGLIHEYEVAA